MATSLSKMNKKQLYDECKKQRDFIEEKWGILQLENIHYEAVIKTLEEENKKLKEVIDWSREWLELCEDDDGNIKNYDLRQLDTRIRPERYIVDN